MESTSTSARISDCDDDDDDDGREGAETTAKNAQRNGMKIKDEKEKKNDETKEGERRDEKGFRDEEIFLQMFHHLLM